MMESPCVKQCRLQQDVCVGCGRTKQEIMVWTKLEASERKKIMEKLNVKK